MNFTLRKRRNFLLVFFAGSLVLALIVFSRRYDFKLRLEVNSNTPSDSQLFYDVGRGFNETDSQHRRLNRDLLGVFQTLSFDLPARSIWKFRFDPLNSAGRVLIRNICITDGPRVLLQIPPGQVETFHDIARLERNGSEVLAVTKPGATDPGLLLNLDARLRFGRITFFRNLRLFLLGLSPVFLLSLMLSKRFDGAARRIDALVERIVAAAQYTSARLTSDFLPLDAAALAFYAACIALFIVLSAFDINGSSIGMYSKAFARGPAQETYLGSPRGTRSDEWGYVTPDILNQNFRADRFETLNSVLGGHSVALTGNIPVRHFSTIFRPQFWAFFVLPVRYAFAVYWQFKALILLTGVFTWLLLITRSTFWSVCGSLWFFFSASTQWSFSWPSALPEMIGSVCWAMVLVCYLTVGRTQVALFVSAGLAGSFVVNFALCAYLPHMVPLVYLSVFFLASWILSKRNEIFLREQIMARAFAAAFMIVLIAIAGSWIFFDLRQAIAGIAETIYPGQRILRGASISPWLLASHFMQWRETEVQFPPAIGNLSEGSGFLWLAPITLLIATRLKLLRMQKYALIALWAVFLIFLAWLIFPIPALIGKYLLLDRTAGARVIPTLGLVNIAIVSLCGANRVQDKFERQKMVQKTRINLWIERSATAAVAIGALFFLLFMTDREFTHFFHWKQLALAAVIGGLSGTFFLLRCEWLLGLSLVVPNVLAFGAVNPVQRGLGVITSSELFHFVAVHPELKKGKWLVYSGTAVLSGFVAATGCDVYTGTHYLPDIDHFGSFAANGVDLRLLNRLGYLTASLRKADEPIRVELPAAIIVQLDVNPSDTILQKLGIRYFAFDSQPPPETVRSLSPLTNRAIDGLWLYRLR